MLNTALTVQEGCKLSHAEVWKKFTDLVIKYISENSSGVVFVLWGSYALSKKELIDDNKDNASFNELHAKNLLDDKTKTVIKDIFDKIILTQDRLIDKYKKLSTILASTNRLPRRYGKDKVIKDIEKQNGKATNPQLTALELNDLRNIYSKLNKRVINDMLSDSPILTDEDHRSIRATIILLKNKLKPILNNKKC